MIFLPFFVVAKVTIFVHLKAGGDFSGGSPWVLFSRKHRWHAKSGWLQLGELRVAFFLEELPKDRSRKNLKGTFFR